jgi:hypothetical protein
MAFARGMPELKVDPDADDTHTARQLWPFVESMLRTTIEDEQPYALEGVSVLPEHVASLSRSQPESVRSCIVGFGRIETCRNIEDIRALHCNGDDSLRDASDDELAEFVERVKNRSATLPVECEILGLRYFEYSTDFERTIEDMVGYLIEGQSDGPVKCLLD